MARRPTRKWTEQQYGPNRYAWLSIGRIEIVLYDGNDRSEYKGGTQGDRDEEEPVLPSYADGLGVRALRLAIRRIGQRPLTLSLTYYTVKELQAMRELINEAFDLAIKRSTILDQAAEEATTRGDDSIPRVYRPDPSIIRRPSALTRLQNEGMVDP